MTSAIKKYLKRQEAGQNAIRLQANPITPDEAAQSVALSRDAGVSPGAALAAPERYRHTLAQKRSSTLLRDAPSLSDWLVSDPINGALAKDDLENLTWWESGLRRLAMVSMVPAATPGSSGYDTVKYGLNAATRGGLGLVESHSQQQAVWAINRRDDTARSFGDILYDERRPVIVDGKEVGRLWAGPGDALAAGYRYAASLSGKALGNDETDAAVAFQNTASTLKERIESIPMSPGGERIKAAWDQVDQNAPFADQLAAYGSIIANNPGDFASFIAQVAGESAPQIAVSAAAGAVTRSVAVGAAAQGGQSLALERGKTIHEELDKSDHDLSTPEGALAALNDKALLAEAVRKGNARGIVIGAMDGLSGGLAGKMLARSPMGNVALQALAQAAMGSGGEALGQLAVDGEITSLGDIILEGLAEFATAPAEVAGIGRRSLLKRAKAASDADNLVSDMEMAAKMAQESQVRERAPDRFKAALDAAGLGDQQVYVPASGLRELFQAKDMALDAETMAAWGIDADTFAEMDIVGGRVAIPISNFAAYLAGTDAEAWVLDNATADPDGMSRIEAQAFNDQMQEILEAEYQDRLAETQADRETLASDQQVYEDAYGQLRAAGQTVDVAEKQARFMTSNMRAMAELAGDDALDLYRGVDLRIKGPDAPGIPRRRGALDAMLNDLRSGRKEQLGQNLTEWVIAQGGVQDRGGDVAQLEGPRGLVAETAAEIRARRAQATLPGALPDAGRGIALDELGRRAVEAGYFPEHMGEVQGLNDAESADLGAALLTALQDEASGNRRYRDGEGPDPARAALNAALQERGLDPATMTNDEIAAALDEGMGQSERDKGGRGAQVQRHGDSVLAPAVVTTTDTAPTSRKEAETALMSMRGDYSLASGEAVSITRSARKIYSGAFPDRRLAIARDIPALLREAVTYADSGQHTYAAALANIDGEAVAVRFVLSHDGSGSAKLYALEGFELTPIARRDENAEVSYREPDGVRPTVGSAPVTTLADVVSVFNANSDAPRPYLQTRRGSITLPSGGVFNGETVIRLFEAADLSTFIHESGHLNLEMMLAIAARPGASDEAVQMAGTIRSYLDMTPDQKAPTTEQHEIWARSWEAYVMEGKSPSLELADVFARMKAWLVRIYRSVAALDVNLTPEIRDVMDRMVATKSEIAEARAEQAAMPLFRDRPAGMSETDWKTYQRMAQRSTDTAEAKLLDRVMEKVRREKEAWWKAERDSLKAEVEAMTNTEPRYRLIEAMANQKYLTNDGAKPAPDMRIDRKLLVEQFGDGILPELTRQKFGGKRAIYGDEGLSPAEAASLFGFPGPVEMIETLQNTPKRGDAIETETDRIMRDRYGDPLTDGTIEQEAMDAIHNDQQARKNVAEARHMAASLGRDTRGMTAQAYRQRARLMLGRMTVREATRSAQFLAGERRAGRDAERAFAKVARGDASALPAALMAKEQQVLNAALYDLSREAQAEVERARERMRDYSKASVRKKLEGGYIEQIDDLLDRFDFRKRSPGQVARAERLADFVQRMIDEGREADLAIDDRLLNEARRTHFTRLSLEEFRGLMDTIGNLDYLGRHKQSLINARRKRDFDASKDRILEMVRQRGRDEMSPPRGVVMDGARGALNASKTIHTIAVELDGLQEMGQVFDELVRDVFAGEKLEAQMRIEMEQAISDIMAAHYKTGDVAAMAKQRHVPGSNGRLWSKAEILSVALNTGSESNYQRLTDQNVAAASERLTPEQVDALLSTLDENDWRFVQAYWDHIGTYTPALAEVHKRRTGVELKRVEAKQMVSAPAFVRGGYYPITYNADKSAAAATDQSSLWDQVMAFGRSGRAKVNDGRTKARAATGGGRALRFDLGVGIEGMRENIRIISLSEAVDNSGRLLRDGEVKQAFLDRQLGSEWKNLDLALQDIASGPIFHSFWAEQGARVLKNNLSAMFLGLNMKTTLLQATGAAQSAAVIGKANLAKGYAAYAQNPVELLAKIKEASTYMANRESTMNKDFADMMMDPANTNPVRSRIGKGLGKIKEASYFPIQKMQYYSVDVPTWAGAYLSRIEQGATEADAVEYADLMIERSQGGSFMSSRSAWARGTVSENIRQSALIRLFTTLAGYMITKLNRGVIEAQRGVKNVGEADGSAGKIAASAEFATQMFLLYVAEGVIMGIVWSMLDDEDETEDFLRFVLKETGMAMVGGLPIIRDAAGFAAEGRGAGGMYETVGAIPGRIWQQSMQGENDRQFRKSWMDGVGAVTGLPTTATSRFIEQIIDEDGDGFSPFEALMGKNPLTR